MSRLEKSKDRKMRKKTGPTPVFYKEVSESASLGFGKDYLPKRKCTGGRRKIDAQVRKAKCIFRPSARAKKDA